MVTGYELSQTKDTYKVLVCQRKMYLDPFLQRSLRDYHRPSSYSVCTLGQKIQLKVSLSLSLTQSKASLSQSKASLSQSKASLSQSKASLSQSKASLSVKGLSLSVKGLSFS
jgi:hypothetical protein